MKTITESTTLRCLLGGLLLLGLAGRPALAQDDPDNPPTGAVGYDLERKIWLFDTDGDTFPDLTEELGGTDPRDPDSNPRALLEAAGGSPEGSKVGFTWKTCRPALPGKPWTDFRPLSGAPNLCISRWVQNAANYTQAAVNCRAQKSRLCTYEDLGYLYLGTPLDAIYNPAGKWLGDFTEDNFVNCGNWTITFDNDPDIWDFEKACSKWEQHEYWCCHDRDSTHP